MPIKLEDLKTQDELDKAIAKAVSDATGDLEGLKSKRDQLLAQEVKLKEKHKDEIEAKDKELSDLKADLEQKLEGNEGYKKLYDKAVEQHTAEVAKLQEKIAASDTAIQELLVTDSLTRELTAANVNPELIDVAISSLSADVAIVEDNGKKVAKVGDKTVADHVKDWAAGNVGKHFIIADENSGGGSPGNDNNNSSKFAEFEKHFKGETWNLTEQSKLLKTNPEAYNTLHAKYPAREAVQTPAS